MRGETMKDTSFTLYQASLYSGTVVHNGPCLGTASTYQEAVRLAGRKDGIVDVYETMYDPENGPYEVLVYTTPLP